MCNPGKYETWEVLDKQEVELEVENEIACSSASQKTCYVNQHPSSTNQCRDYKSLSNQSSFDVDSKVDCGECENYQKTSEIGRKKETEQSDFDSCSKCDSIETLTDEEMDTRNKIASDSLFRKSDFDSSRKCHSIENLTEEEIDKNNRLERPRFDSYTKCNSIENLTEDELVTNTKLASKSVLKISEFDSFAKCNSIENLTEAEIGTKSKSLLHMSRIDSCRKCDSIENLTDEEMADGSQTYCDLEIRQAFLGDSPVKERTSSSDDSDVIREKLADAMKENSRTTSEESVDHLFEEPIYAKANAANEMYDNDDGKNVSDTVKLDDCDAQLVNLRTKPGKQWFEGSIDRTFSLDDMEMDSDSVEVETEKVGSGSSTQHFESVDEMLNALDAAVTIRIDPCEVTDTKEDNTCEMYAVCQELLDDKVDSGLMSDMMSSSCHSLEDLTADNEINDLPSTSQQVSNEKVYLRSETKGLRKGSGRLSSSSMARNKWKQSLWSEKERSDSGFHEHNSVTAIDSRTSSQDLLKPTSVPKSNSCPESVIVNSSLPVSSADKGCEQSSDTDTSTQRKNVTSSISKSNSYKRQTSVDIPLTYHPGQDLVPTPVLNSLARVSPNFSQGTRTFTPKRFSVQRKIAQSPIKLFRQLPIVKNYYMSPLLAPDDLLKGLPEIHLAVSIKHCILLMYLNLWILLLEKKIDIWK